MAMAGEGVKARFRARNFIVFRHRTDLTPFHDQKRSLLKTQRQAATNTGLPESTRLTFREQYGAVP